VPSGGAQRAAGDDNEGVPVSPATCKVVALARQRSTTEDRRRARVLSRLKEQAMAVRESVFERSDSCARPTCSRDAVAGCCPCQARITDSPPAFQRPKQVEAYGWAKVRRPQRCVPLRQREEVQEMPRRRKKAMSDSNAALRAKRKHNIHTTLFRSGAGMSREGGVRSPLYGTVDVTVPLAV